MDVQPLFAELRDHTERLVTSFGRDAHPQHRFEQFLKALNERLAAGVREGLWELPIQQFHGLVGIVCDDQMYLSGTGDLTALFLHYTPQGRYQVFNLFRSIQTEQSLPTWEKAFAIVLDGDLAPGDILCTGTDDIVRHVPNDELNEILSTLPPSGAAEKIRHYFPATSELGILVVRMEAERAVPYDQARPLTELSLEHLNETMDDADRHITDQAPKIGTMVKHALAWGRKLAQGEARVLLQRVKTRAIAGGRYVVRTILPRLLGLMKESSGHLAKLTHKETRTHTFEETKTRINNRLTGVVRSLNGLPSTSKYLFVAAIGVFAAFTIGITVLSHARTNAAEEATYAAKVTQAEELRDQAEGMAIIRDEGRARSLYSEALALARALPTDTTTRKNTSEALVHAIESSLDELRHVTLITDPPKVADLASGVNGAALAFEQGILRVFGSDKGVYRLDPSQKTLTREDTAVGDVGIAKNVSGDEGTFLFLDNRPGISRFDATNGQEQITSLAPETGTTWSDLAWYGNKLYILSPSSEQIIKYNPAGAGFDGGTDWIRAKQTSLNEATSMAIDATIFVLTKGGEIARFAGGGQMAWKPAEVDPPLQGSTTLWTSPESTFLYVLDPTRNRLVVFQKETGALVVQYRSDVWSSLTDFAVDEGEKTIYLLSGSTVYAIKASHLP